MSRFLRAGIDVCSTAMTPWVWPTTHLNPPNWIAPITEACELGESSCFTTGIDPGFANDLFPMTLMGLCAEVRKVRASELLDYTNYSGDYDFEMGIGKPPEFKAMFENGDILVFAWGGTVPMIAHAAGIMLDEITTTYEKWVTPTERKTAKGVIQPGQRCCGPLHRQRRLPFRDAHPARARQPHRPRRRTRTGRPAPRTTSIESTSRELQASSKRPHFASLTALAAMPPPLVAWPPACAR